MANAQSTTKHSPIARFPPCHIGARLLILPPSIRPTCKRLQVFFLIMSVICKRLQISPYTGGQICKRLPIWHNGNRGIGECLIVGCTYTTTIYVRSFSYCLMAQLGHRSRPYAGFLAILVRVPAFSGEIALDFIDVKPPENACTLTKKWSNCLKIDLYI